MPTARKTPVAATTAAAPTAATATLAKPANAAPAATRRPSQARKTPTAQVKSAKSAKSAKTAKSPAAKAPPKATKSAKAPKKPPKLKALLVRDGFTMPEADFALIATLKARALAAQRDAKKSELLRAGLHALAALDSGALVAALGALEPVKIGRPKKGQ